MRVVMEAIHAGPARVVAHAILVPPARVMKTALHELDVCAVLYAIPIEAMRAAGDEVP